MSRPTYRITIAREDTGKVEVEHVGVTESQLYVVVRLLRQAAPHIKAAQALGAAYAEMRAAFEATGILGPASRVGRGRR